MLAVYTKLTCGVHGLLGLERARSGDLALQTLAVYTKLTCGVHGLPVLNESRLDALALQTRVASNKFGIRNGEGQALALRFAGGNYKHPP